MAVEGQRGAVQQVLILAEQHGSLNGAGLEVATTEKAQEKKVGYPVWFLCNFQPLPQGLA